MFVSPFPFQLLFKAFATTGLHLEGNSHWFFTTIYICTYYSTSWQIFFFYLKNFCWFPKFLTSPLKNLPWLPRQSWLLFSGMVHVSITMLFTLTYSYSFTYMSALRLNCQLLTTGTVSYSFPTTFYYAFHSWHVKGWLYF